MKGEDSGRLMEIVDIMVRVRDAEEVGWYCFSRDRYVTS